MLIDMKGIKNHLLKQAKHIQHFVRPLSIPDYFMHKNVPYFCQWESPELAQQLLEKIITTDDDPRWKNSGAKTKQEYHDWSWSGCGMACTKMILAHCTGKNMPLVKLGITCAQYGGYVFPLEQSAGLYYKPFVTFVEKELHWKAKIIQGMTLTELMYELSKGSYVIASVSPHIRHPNSKPKNKGGHLVLLLGYDQLKQIFYFHNPSGISKETQDCAAIHYSNFKKFFSGRGIVIRIAP